MKLYTRKYVGHKHEPYRYTEVDPADLELAALGMWEKLKSEASAQYTKAQKRRWRNVEQFFFNLIRAMAKLESAADLKVPEILVRAKAWKIMAPRLDKLDGYYKELGIEVKGCTSEYILAHARAELEADTSVGEKGEEKDATSSKS